MYSTKKNWIFLLVMIVFLQASFAMADSSQAARANRGGKVLLLVSSSDNPGKSPQDDNPQATDKIEQKLLTVLEETGSADFIVRFTEQADLSAAYSMEWDARGVFVYDTLRETAAKSQANAKAILDAAGLKYQTFFAGNELYVWNGTLSTANELAALVEVSYIRATRTYKIDPIEEVKPLEDITWAGDLLSRGAVTRVGNSPEALAWGIVDTKADQFWTTYGVQGDGIVVANIDTGVDYTHVALDQSYKCAADPLSPACWLDPGTDDCPGPNDGPCDTIYQGIFHGTHTMGIMVGDDDPTLDYQVGMASNAQWIACLGCPNGSCPEFDANSCADWIIAPNGNPANRPNVVNNSWGGDGGDTWYLAKVNAWRAAGVFPAFSAGNLYICNTLGSPGDYQESFASAAHNSSRSIASFSSRGPSAFGHDPYTKPNISAPGVNIISAQPGDKWAALGGTSMASPHSAGAVALLWSCNPDLIGQIDAAFQLLQDNTDTPPAGNCGAPPDGQGNYTYGYGFLNMLKIGLEGCVPTAVNLYDFKGVTKPSGIELSWHTAQELDLLGFNLYRAEAMEGHQVKINPQLIPGINPGQVQGNEYLYLDTTVKSGKSYYYWVEWVGLQSSETYGPVITSFTTYQVWLPMGFR